MKIQALQLTEFRNFERQKVEFRPRINFFVGDNGQGKTNLIEAVYLLCRGISFRPSDAESLLRNGGGGRAKISGLFVQKNLEYTVALEIERGKKSALINGKRANSATLMAQFPLVLFSPESLSAIKEGPDQRRQLIDELLISHDPRQARLLREFTRALKARNRLLKNITEGLGSRSNHEHALESLNKIYFLLATHLTTARLKAFNDLEPEIQEAMQSILDESTADISVDYVISGESALHMSESEVFDALRKRHAVLGVQEFASGTSLVGPHKHDIKLLFAGNDSRFYCSQGQQRALILALKIAQIVYHHRVHQTYPVLLLDDVMSELDAKKRVNLMKFLEGISAQILITATDLTWPEQFGLDQNSVFSVTEGRILGQVGSQI
jgi:DNA replication and repair protein RecF